MLDQNLQPLQDNSMKDLDNLVKVVIMEDNSGVNHKTSSPMYKLRWLLVGTVLGVAVSGYFPRRVYVNDWKFVSQIVTRKVAWMLLRRANMTRLYLLIETSICILQSRYTCIHTYSHLKWPPYHTSLVYNLTVLGTKGVIPKSLSICPMKTIRLTPRKFWKEETWKEKGKQS